MGGGLPVPLSFGVSDRFALEAIVEFKTILSASSNVLRVSKPGLLECVPCIDFEAVGSDGGKFTLTFNTHTVSATVTNLLANDYFLLEASLVDRTLAFKIYQGTTKATLAGSNIGVYHHDFPEHAERTLFFAKGARYNVRGSYSPSVSMSKTLLGSARAYFRVGASTFLTNNIRTNGTTAALTRLLPASGVAAYSGMFPSHPTTSADGPGGAIRSVCFDGEAALIHDVTDSRFVLDGAFNDALTSCAWIRRTGPIDTLFTTFIDGAHQIRLYTWLDELSGLAHGHNALDTRTSAILQLGSWNHVCFGAAVDGPAKVWVNGTLVSAQTDTAVTSPSPATRPLAIGGSSNLLLHTTLGIDRGAKACISEIVVFGREISTSDAVRLYSAGVAGVSLNDL